MRLRHSPKRRESGNKGIEPGHTRKELRLLRMGLPLLIPKPGTKALTFTNKNLTGNFIIELGSPSLTYR